jgi:predicted small lipoprotein YifL
MKVYPLLILLVSMPLLYGCGQTGPLYLPGTVPPIHTEKPQPSADETKPQPEKQTPSKNQ